MAEFSFSWTLKRVILSPNSPPWGPIRGLRFRKHLVGGGLGAFEGGLIKKGA